ncbi:hypothetical protein [Kitasatospora sp. NPDC085879]|uniref:hypothetical protein n=1 Tax=Kitasatospora sp. NPDC085879 TaxID=3154769 RepID=UPI000BB12DDA|nr:hypothetical protein [Streptomyces sp. TLI_235]PBC70987.1 hypothetical protein BX265_5552 [Streptomyces sp. TLI_235]
MRSSLARITTAAVISGLAVFGAAGAASADDSLAVGGNVSSADGGALAVGGDAEALVEHALAVGGDASSAEGWAFAVGGDAYGNGLAGAVGGDSSS